MRIHGLSVVKNERDIVVECYEAAVKWCDFIYVLDNGSTDGTWECVLELSSRFSGIVPYRQDSCVFQPSLRAKIFDQYRKQARHGDWWCRLDADEFYIDNPKEFLAKVPDKYQLVWTSGLTYYFTDEDYKRYQRDPSLYEGERPVNEKCRFYLNNWSERRFLRHRDDMVWNTEESWPYRPGLSYPGRIRVKHFQWRSPSQMQNRLNVRFDSIERGCTSFLHERAENWEARVFNKSVKRDIGAAPLKYSWRDRIVDASKLDYDLHDGRYVWRKDMMPKIKGSKNWTIEMAFRRVKKVLTRNRHDNGSSLEEDQV